MGNNSGIDHTVINSRERALSTDLNVLQSQAGKSRAEMMRRLVNDLDGPTGRGFEEVQVQDGTPLAADIYGGLRVRIMSDHLLVTPGTIGVMSAIGTPDANDSEYVLIDDPGVQLSTTLLFVANAGPGIRVDVVECQPLEIVITTDNRDRFNPTTGLFSPETVNKTVGGRLRFRIRQGTQGAGYPGNVAGWLPIAVAIHPSGSAMFSPDVFFFDVRPLVQERNLGLSNNHVDINLLEERICRNSVLITGGLAVLRGAFDYNFGGPGFIDIGFYRSKGRIQNTRPGATNDIGDFILNDANNLIAGADFTTVSRKWMYVLAMFPEGLPRWVSYSVASLLSGERFPKNVSGILALTEETATAINESGTTSPIVPPAIYGLTNTTEAVVIATVRQTDVPAENFIETYRLTHGRMRWPDRSSVMGTRQVGIIIGGDADGDFIEWDLGLLGQELSPTIAMLPHLCTAFKCRIEIFYDSDVTTDVFVSQLLLTRGVSRVVMASSEVDIPHASSINGPARQLSFDVDFLIPGIIQTTAPGGTTGNFFVRADVSGFVGSGLTTTSRLLSVHEVTTGV